MKYVAVSVSLAAALAVTAACTNIVTVHEYHTGKEKTHVDTVYVVVDPSETPGGYGESGPPEGSGSGSTDPVITYHQLYGGARIETCTYLSGSVKHTLQGNAVTGSGPQLVTDARVWWEDDLITELVLLLEFEPEVSGTGTFSEETPSRSGCARTTSETVDTGRSSDPSEHTEAQFLRIRSGDQRYTFDLDDCTTVDVYDENQNMLVAVTLPVSPDLLRDMAHSNSVSVTICYPGTDTFTKYFTEMNDGNIYQFYSLFVADDENRTVSRGGR